MPTRANSEVLVLPSMMAPALLDAFDDGGVFFGDAVFEEEGAGGGGDALGHLSVFDGDGQAVEGAEPVARMMASSAALASARAWSWVTMRKGVKLGVDSFDPLKEEFGEFDGGDLLGGDKLEEVGGGGVGEFLVRHGADVP